VVRHRQAPSNGGEIYQSITRAHKEADDWKDKELDFYKVEIRRNRQAPSPPLTAPTHSLAPRPLRNINKEV